jgi:hypothetical protein
MTPHFTTHERENMIKKVLDTAGNRVNEQDEMLDLIIEGVRPYGAGDPVAVAIDVF